MAGRLQGRQGLSDRAAELNKLSGEVDLDGKSIEEVAAEWVAANEAKWKAWAQ